MAKSKKQLARFYNINSILGNNWANFFVVIGSRDCGKSYSCTDFLCKRKKTLGDKCKNYWIRISETSTKALLINRADKLVDPDLKRKYDLDLTTKGSVVFNRGIPFMEVLPLSGFAKSKGVAYYDKDFEGEYNLVIDEFVLERGEKRTGFNIYYNFIGVIENLLRDTKNTVRVFFLANSCSDASGLLAQCFNFLPEGFGRFYLKNKACVIDNLEPTEAYLKDREQSITSKLGADKMANYTNQVKKDRALLYKGPLRKPTTLIMFDKEPDSWYTVWDSKIIKKYKGEPKAASVIAMRPYINAVFDKDLQQTVFDLYNARAFLFRNLMDLSTFTEELSLIKKT